MRLAARLSLLSILLACTTVHGKSQRTANANEQARASDEAQVQISAPPVMEAGENASFSITLDKAPNFLGAAVGVELGQRNPAINISTSVSAVPGQRTYTFSIKLPTDAIGIWEIRKVTFYDGTSSWSDLRVEPVTFRVVPKGGLVVPTSAHITLDLSQVQLLRREADNIRRRIRQLKSDLQTVTNDSVARLLRLNLDNSVTALNLTESAFKDLVKSDTLRKTSEVFFGDLRLNYKSAITSSQTSQRKGAVPFRQVVMLVPNEDSAVQAERVLRVLEQNELAYNYAASASSLTFDLEVSSIPAGAEISYRRRGDNFQKHPSATNSTIKSLPLAIWIVRFQKKGFADVEREHDPFRESNHSIVVELK